MQIKRKKIKYLSFIPIIIITLLLFKIVQQPEIIPNILKYILSVFSYIIWAYAIAYLLNPLMVFLERKFKIHRIFSILIIYLFFLAIIIVIVVFIAPVLFNNVLQLGNNLQDYANNTQKWVFDSIKSLKVNDTYNIYAYLAK